MLITTDITVEQLRRMWMLVSVNTAQLVFVAYCTKMLSSEDTNIMLNVTMPDQVWIWGSKQILQLFTYSDSNTSIGG